MLFTMKIRQFVFLLLTAGALQVSAQSNNVQSAATYYGYSEKSEDKEQKLDEITKAKEYIDKAATHEQTSNNPKMWYYRGKIYLAISRARDPRIKSLDPDAAEKSTLSFLNCLKTDTKENYKDECKDLVWVAAVGVFNSAVEAYSSNQLDKALRLYNLIFEVIPHDKDKNLSRNNITPEIIYRNIYFTAYKAKNNKMAKEYLQKLIDMNYNDPSIYIYMSRIHLEEKDTAKALSILEKGKSLFDNNGDLLTEELNIYISKGNTDVLLDKLTKAIEADPEKEILYYNRGTIYQKKKDFAKAEQDYKKAIEIKDDYFDAYYNLGVMVFNQGVEIINKANDLKSDAAFNKEKARADGKFKEAVPYLEKARQLGTEDKAAKKFVLQSLKELYVRQNNTEKYKEVKDELEKL
jgi:tetratricopeptide (TPR) repeat protein